jgi:hypothetical protein
MTESMDAMKKGGKAKRKGGKKKGKKAGDAVLLHKGKAPRKDAGVGIAQRLMTPGSLFGGGLPGPLQTVSYASAPAVARPISRMEFVGSSDAYYNRNRNKTDDVQIDVNPADIKPDLKPSIRFQPSSNPNAFPPVPYIQYNQANWYGEVPRLNKIEVEPSSRAVASQPTTGFMLNNRPILMDVAGVGHIDSSSSQSAFAPSAPMMEEPVMEEEPEEEAGLGAIPYPKTSLPPIAGAVKGQRAASYLVRQHYPTLKELHDAGYYTYKEAEKAYRDGKIAYKRGGRVNSVF